MKPKSAAREATDRKLTRQNAQARRRSSAFERHAVPGCSCAHRSGRSPRPPRQHARKIAAAGRRRAGSRAAGAAAEQRGPS